MKALELAEALVGHLPKYKTPSQERGLINGAIEELRRLAAVESDCAPYLKEGETPAERIKRALGDSDSLMNLYRDVMALKAELEHALAECRDAYPVPEVGSELEGLWGQAMGAPASVGEYVKACAASQQKEIDELRAELERIKSLPPVAWEVYVEDADNAYVVESLDDPQLIDDCTNSDAVVTPLIALGSKT